MLLAKGGEILNAERTLAKTQLPQELVNSEVQFELGEKSDPRLLVFLIMTEVSMKGRNGDERKAY